MWRDEGKMCFRFSGELSSGQTAGGCSTRPGL